MHNLCHLYIHIRIIPGNDGNLSFFKKKVLPHLYLLLLFIINFFYYYLFHSKNASAFAFSFSSFKFVFFPSIHLNCINLHEKSNLPEIFFFNFYQFITVFTYLLIKAQIFLPKNLVLIHLLILIFISTNLLLHDNEFM